ncbi:T9SS type B sorting domain-containing protein [Flavobacteriaceae bacterium]|nr:T9SS type B sorting domain-containing protein [Flavobacteriaceae bacterium]
MLKLLRNIVPICVITAFLCVPTSLFGQLSKVHYLPPLPYFQTTNAAEDYFHTVYIYISTPEPVANFTIRPLGSAASAWVSSSVTNNNSYKFALNHNIIGAYAEDFSAQHVFQNKGYKVVSDKEIYVSVRVRHNFHAGAIVSKGLDGLGTRFRVAGMERTTSNDMSFFSIISTQNNNAISFTANGAPTTSLNSPLPTSVILNKDEVFIASFYSDDAVNNIGTLITSTKEIVVNTGSLYGSFSNEIIDNPYLTPEDEKNYFTGGDMGIDQLVSINPTVDATSYIIVKGDSFNSIENALIIADEDGTKVEINGSPYKDPESGKDTLNAGEHFFVEGSSYSATSPLQYMYITSNKNVYLFQGTGDKYTVLNGRNRHNYSANQGMFFVPPLNCASTGDVESIARIDEVDGGGVSNGGAFSGSAFVLSKSGSTVTLNGAPIGPQAAGEIDIPIGGVDAYTIHRVNNIVGDVAIVGSDELYVSYFNVNSAATSGAFYSGFTLEPKISPELTVGTLGSCLFEDGTSNVIFNIPSSAYDGFDEFKWQKKNSTTNLWEDIFNNADLKDAKSYTPKTIGQYRAAAIINCLPNPARFSEPLVIGYCPADFDKDGVIDNLDQDNDNDGIYNSLESYGNIPVDFSDINAPLITVPSGAENTAITSVVDKKSATITGDATGQISAAFSPGTSEEASLAYRFDNAVTLRLTYAAAAQHNISDKEAFTIQSINENAPVTMLNPSGELLIDTNLDGVYESDVLEYSASSIQFSFNPSVAYDGGYDFSFNKSSDAPSDGVRFLHKVSNNTDASTFNGQLELINYRKDSDGDGITDALSLDSDGDGCLDYIEAGFTDEDNPKLFGSAALGVESGTILGDGTVAAHDYTLPIRDYDSNGIYDFQEPGLIPSFSSQPLAATVTEGGTASFTIDIINANSFQWLMDGAPITNSATFNISADGKTLSVSTTDTSLDGKKFSVLVKGESYLCTSSSVEATLSVLVAPTIPVLDRVYSFCFSGLATDVKLVSDLKTAIGRSDINIYEEETGGAPLADAVQLIDGEDYFVSAVNSLGAESPIRSVTNVIIASPELVSSETNNAICLGDPITITANGVPQTVFEFESRLDSTYEKFLSYGGSHYFLKKDPMPWTSAKNLIKSLGSGASMYVINSKNEENAVYNELVNRGYAGTAGNHFWLGLRQVDALKNGQVDEGWVWLDGRLLTSADANWNNTTGAEPNDYGGANPTSFFEDGAEDYGQFDFDPGNMEWNDMADNGGGGNSWPIFEFEGVSEVKWYREEMGGTKTQITGITSNSIVETPSVTTTYFYEITVNGVVCEDSVIITVNDLPTMLPANDITACDNNLDGDSTDTNEAAFDLAQQRKDILLSVIDRNVFFYESSTAAVVDSIATAALYTNTTNPQTLFYKVVNTDTGCVSDSLRSFDLIVDDLPPEITIADLHDCDDDTVGNDKDGEHTFDLTQRTAQILTALGGTTAEFDITYYASLANAKNDVSAITTYTTLPTDGSEKEIFVRIKDNLTGCIRYDNSFKVVVDKLPTALISTIEIEQCESDGQIKYNLNTLVDRYSANAANETFEFYLDAALTSPAVDPENFVVPVGISAQNVYIKIIDNNSLCARFDDVFTAGGPREPIKVSFAVGTNNVPATFTPLTFYDCVDESSGVPVTGTFDTSIFNDIRADLLAADPDYNIPTVEINFYKSESDAVFQRNAIDVTQPLIVNPPLKTQEIWAGIQDVGVKIECLGRIKVADLILTPFPTFDLPSTQVFCTNLGTDLISITNQGGAYAYAWALNGAALTQTSTDISIATGGTYEVTATNTLTGCETTKTIVVYESEFPLFDLDDLTVFDLTGDGSNRIEVLTGIGELGIGDYEFALDGGAYQNSPVFEDVPPGIHQVSVRDKNGCGTKSVAASVIGYPLYFTPNGNGQDDNWQVLGVNGVFQSQSLIYIFDRHGRLLAQIKTDGPGWDGTYNGTPMPADDYWFRVGLEDGRTFTGHFSLIR